MVVTAHDRARAEKEKGRRSWDGGPSGLLLLETPGPAESKAGRSLRLKIPWW